MRGFRILSLLIVAVIGLPCCAAAQEHPSSLDEVLARAHASYDEYLHTVPNIFAQERLVSGIQTREAPMQPEWGSHTQVESSFRMRRIEEKGGVTLEETRQYQSVNGKRSPEDLKAVAIPTTLAGAFSLGGSFIAPQLKDCYDYQLMSPRKWEKSTVIVLSYTAKLHAAAQHEVCRTESEMHGLAFLDPQSMQLVHFEQTRPQHELDPKEFELRAEKWWNNIPGPLAAWTWSIDYMPVVLNGQTFWLPKKTSSKIESKEGRWVVWSFAAEYANYHLTTVHSMILTTPGTPPKP